MLNCSEWKRTEKLDWVGIESQKEVAKPTPQREAHSVVFRKERPANKTKPEWL